MAEQDAWDVARKKGVDLVVVILVPVLGPLLQPTVNASIGHVLKYVTGSAKTYANSVQAYVHVRDVALPHILECVWYCDSCCGWGLTKIVL